MCKKRSGGIKYTHEQIKDAVIALCSRNGSAKEIAEEYSVTREALYNWKRKLLDKEYKTTVQKREGKPLPDDKNALLSEIESLKTQIKRLKLEKDILGGR